jgi:hypothetical protein
MIIFSGMSCRVGSIASSRQSGRSRSYRTKSKRSEVDESLFGSANSAAKLRANCRSNKPETVQVITKDLIRNVVVPSKDKAPSAICISQNTIKSVRDKSVVRTREEIQLELENARQEQQDSMDAAALRKKKFQEADLEKQENEELNDLEREAKHLNEGILEKAKMQRLEQEDEIKHLNELMLNAKCHAIRDAQILEKEEIKCEIQEEENRLDIIREVHRLNAIKDGEKIEQMKHEKRIEGARQIMDQIRTNTVTRILEEEKKNAESAALLAYIEKLQHEDLAELERKRDTQIQIQKEIELSEQERMIQKQRKAAEEEILAEQVASFIKKKEEREARYAQEIAEIKRLKEEKQLRLLRLQESAQGDQARQDAIRAKRNQEATEREWRRKELEEQLRKEESDKKMKIAREAQIKQKEHFQAVQAERERQVFERILQSQIEEAKKEKERDESRQSANLRHAAEIRKQIISREQKRIRERQNFFEEAEKKIAEEIDYKNKLREVKLKKLEQLRRAGVPEKYTAEVMRRALDDGQKPLGNS